eukprot:TRINITY_DN1124_c0_g1_i2.p1 TRINITY_DN1124_c0_g1~~TRINITY_DN1124_c0_g1_i2.p1  ORF type:complete len:583 (-),score=241.36 TRINITY_DN1124_c0_g1_i2:26-1774(-)
MATTEQNDQTILLEAVNLMWNMKFTEANQLLIRLTNETLKLQATQCKAQMQWFLAIASEQQDDVSIAFNLISETSKFAKNFKQNQNQNNNNNNNKNILENQQSTENSVFGFMKNIIGFQNQNQIIEALLSGSTPILANSHLMRAMLLLKTENYVKGGLALHKSWKMYEECNSTLAKIAEKNIIVSEEIKGQIKFGIALFHFIMSLVPNSLLWLVEAIGFEADRVKGILGLKETSSCLISMAPLACLLYLWIQIFFTENLIEANNTMTIYMERFSNSFPFLYLGGYLHRKNGNLSLAKDFFQRSHDCSTEVRQMQLICIYEMGDCLILENEWEKAAQMYEQFLQENKSTSYRCFCAFQLGICYSMLDQSKQAVEAFKKVSLYERKHFDYDRYAARKATSFVKRYYDMKKLLKNKHNTINICKDYDNINPMDNLSKMLMIAFYHRKSLKLEDCENKLKIIFSEIEKIKQLSNDEQKQLNLATVLIDAQIQYFYIYGRLKRLQKQTNSAISFFNEIISNKNEIKKENFIVPHSLVEIAEILIETNQTNAAREHLEQAKNSNHFDFAKPLSRRIQHCFDTIAGLVY